jgi:hypothetical protein
VELLGEDPGRRIEEQTFVSAVLGWLAAREQVEGPAGEREDDEAGMAEEEEPEMTVYSYGSTSLLLNIDWSVASAGAARCEALKSNSIKFKKKSIKLFVQGPRVTAGRDGPPHGLR